MNTDELQAAVPAQAKPRPKTLVIESGRLPQIVRRLFDLGFNYSDDGVYVNSNPHANVQRIAWARDRIDAKKWAGLLIWARNPAQVEADLQRLGICQADDIISDEQQQAELERGLRLAKEYWRRIYRCIKDRPLGGEELYMARDAHQRLQKAQGNAKLWNSTEEGKRCPVSADVLADFTKDEFREPEEFCRDENLKPETLAAIAVPLTQKRTAEFTPIAAVRAAHELLMTARRYMRTVPEQKRGTACIVEPHRMAFNTVTFAEIAASNRTDSGKLPYLPPVAQKRKGRTEQESPLSEAAIKTAVKRFLNERTLRLTQQEYERDQEQTETLAKEGKLPRKGTGEPRTYQEWQSDNQKVIDDCLQNDRIRLRDLCELRWERFKRQCETRKRGAAKHPGPKRKSKKNSRRTRPSSAASSPETSGKPEK